MTILTVCVLASVGAGIFTSKTTTDPVPRLKDAFAGRFTVGAAISPRHFSNPAYLTLVKGQFNSVTAENEMKPAPLLKAPGEYDFTQADEFMKFAEANGMEVIGHTLIWHSQSPAFLFEDAAGKPLPREVALKNMRDHIFAVMGRYKGRIKGWDVVNEAVSDGGGLRDTPALRAIGPDYLLKAFQFAAEADPGAELYYNDYNIDLDYKRPSGLKLVKELREQGARIDAVGIQGHYMVTQSLTEITKGIQAYLDAGFKVAITELDVDVLPRNNQGGADISAVEREGLDPYRNGLPTEIQTKLADWYAAYFRYLVSQPGVIRVTFWGVGDGQSWLNNFPVRGRTNHPLLFDREFRPKPAFFSVLEAAKSGRG